MPAPAANADSSGGNDTPNMRTDDDDVESARLSRVVPTGREADVTGIDAVGVGAGSVDGRDAAGLPSVVACGSAGRLYEMLRRGSKAVGVGGTGRGMLLADRLLNGVVAVGADAAADAVVDADGTKTTAAVLLLRAGFCDGNDAISRPGDETDSAAAAESDASG